MHCAEGAIARYVDAAAGIMMFKYTAEMQDFIRKNADGKRWDELTGLFNAEFGTNKTPRQIQSQAHDIGVRNGIQQRNPLGGGDTARAVQNVLIKTGMSLSRLPPHVRGAGRISLNGKSIINRLIYARTCCCF